MRLGPREESLPVARSVIEHAQSRGLTIATAESLTGGAVVSALVDVPGASPVVMGGTVCYSLAIKHAVLGIDEELLAQTGAVSEQVAIQMATAARELYRADIAVATTGVAGPGSDSHGNPAGSVWLAIADGSAVCARHLQCEGDRAAVRTSTVEEALAMLEQHVRYPSEP